MNGADAEQISSPGDALLASVPASARLSRVESGLVQIVASLLEVEPSEIDLSDSLAGLGVDSLTAAQLSIDIEEAFGVTVHAGEFSGEAPLTEMAKWLLEAWIAASDGEPDKD